MNKEYLGVKTKWWVLMGATAVLIGLILRYRTSSGSGKSNDMPDSGTSDAMTQGATTFGNYRSITAPSVPNVPGADLNIPNYPSSNFSDFADFGDFADIADPNLPDFSFGSSSGSIWSVHGHTGGTGYHGHADYHAHGHKGGHGQHGGGHSVHGHPRHHPGFTADKANLGRLTGGSPPSVNLDEHSLDALKTYG